MLLCSSAGCPFSLEKPLFSGSVYDRRAREIPAEVKTLKAQLPKPVEGQESPSSPLTGQIAALEQARHLPTGLLAKRAGLWPPFVLPFFCNFLTSQCLGRKGRQGLQEPTLHMNGRQVVCCGARFGAA